VTLRTQVILLLLAGLAILCGVFFTDIVLHRRRLRSLPPHRHTEAIPYTAIVAAGIGLACVWFSAEYLIFGTHPLPYPLRASPIILPVLVIASAAIKRIRSR
jgi:hypothetical protein